MESIFRDITNYILKSLYKKTASIYDVIIMHHWIM